MISKRSCDTENWSNEDIKKLSVVHHIYVYSTTYEIFKYNITQFEIVRLFHNIIVFTVSLVK